MKCSKTLAVLCVAVILLFVARVSADPVLSISVDEDGNGLPFRLAADPGPGGLASVLTYTLPPGSLVAGDVLLQDGTGGPILDVVRFNPKGTGGADYPNSLVFYSDTTNLDGPDNLADTPTPPGALYTNNVTIPEVGLEGFNGAIYTPVAGQPGFITGFQTTYTLISDTPEPASLTLFGIAGLSLAARAWRRRKLPVV